MNFFISILPVFIFLAILIYLDSFKLVRYFTVFLCISYGILIAYIAFLINNHALNYLGIDFSFYSKFVAPILEEVLKVSILVYFIQRSKVGFMIDSAILGYSVGAGFSFFENLFYLQTLTSENPTLWAVRGFGTAIMHGGADAIFAILAIYAINRGAKNPIKIFLPGLVGCILIHSVYNQFIMPPIITTVVYFTTLTLIIILIFLRNEISLRDWLDLELDSEIKLLSIIKLGKFSDTTAGQYIISIKKRFSSENIVDIICYIQLYLELSIRAKSILLMKDNGFPIERDETLISKLKELKTLQKNIGKAGILAITPILKFKQKDIWKLNMLEDL